MMPCLVVTVRSDVLLGSDMNRQHPADQHISVWLQHVQPEQGRYQRKRVGPYISVAHPDDRTRGRGR